MHVKVRWKWGGGGQAEVDHGLGDQISFNIDDFFFLIGVGAAVAVLGADRSGEFVHGPGDEGFFAGNLIKNKSWLRPELRIAQSVKFFVVQGWYAEFLLKTVLSIFTWKNSSKIVLQDHAKISAYWPRSHVPSELECCASLHCAMLYLDWQLWTRIWT